MFKVTVIIRTYNRADRIGECLDSIYNQTERENIQCLIINDCSSDNTIEVIESYKKSHPELHIDLINSPINLKPGGALIESKKYIKGDYCLVLDDDDKYNYLEIIENLYNFAKSENYDVCFPTRDGGLNCYHQRIIFKSELFKKCPISRSPYYEDHYTHWFSYQDTKFKIGYYDFPSIFTYHPSFQTLPDNFVYGLEYKLHRIFEDLFYNKYRINIDCLRLYLQFLEIDCNILAEYMKLTWDDVFNEFERLGIKNNIRYE